MIINVYFLLLSYLYFCYFYNINNNNNKAKQQNLSQLLNMMMINDYV